MKALSYNPQAEESNFLSLIEIDKPLLSTTNAIVRVTGVGVCGSDLLKLDRALVQSGTILGHEMVGVIDEISDEMSTNYDLKQGDRILSSHHVPCLECDFCLRGKESLCQDFKSSNFNPGAFCEYLELSEAHLKHTVQKIPDHLSDEEASFTEPVACCLKAVRSTVIAASSSLRGASTTNVIARSVATKQSPNCLVIGLGSIGLIMGQLIKHYAPNSHVTGLDLNKDRLDLAGKLGFDNALASLEGDQPSLRGANGDEAISSIEAGRLPRAKGARNDGDNKYDYIYLCAGANATVELASKYARNGATIVVFSSTPGDSSFNNNDIYYKELTIMGSYSPNLIDLKESLELISSARIQVQDLITHRAKLENLGEVIKNCNQEQGIKSYLNN